VIARGGFDMCGIAAIYSERIQEKDRDILRRMNERMLHRGPDGYGYYFDEMVGLAHRRLSIIDLSENGKQPMANEDGSLWITFNGEIYNFQDLRHDLQMKGHAFRSNTDTEVLVHLYEEYPESFLEKLRGMFAFAIWDKNRKRIVAARDRLGKKPLYYHHTGKVTILASEIKALLEHPRIDVKINQEALTEFVAFKYSLSRETVFKGIHRVLPGEVLIVGQDGIKIEKYWDVSLEFKERAHKDLIEEYISIFKEAVQLRLISDVPLGAFLSGGMDSTSVVYAMTEFSKTPVKTFTMGFDSSDKTIEEGRYAEIASKYFGTEHHERKQLSESIDQLEQIIYFLDEPIADPAVIPTFNLFDSAGEFLKVILTGEGSDETNAGYSRYPASNLILSLLNTSATVSHFLGDLVRFMPGYARGYQMFSLPRKDAWLYLTLLFGKEYGNLSLIRTILSEELHDSFDDSINRVKGLYNPDDGAHPLQKMFYLDLKGWLASDLLMKVDKMSMAHSVEARAPFLDHKLVEFAMSIPPWEKFNLSATKRVLRDAMNGHIPREILKRRQHGFLVPVDNWFRSDLTEYLRSKMQRLIDRGVVNGSLQGIVERYLGGDNSLRTVIWRLLVLEIWFEVFVDGIWKTYNNGINGNTSPSHI
jgi:asparagine synthase (glutamine-hydrolysing)